MKTTFYAGLGSPETPVHIQFLMSEMAEELARKGFGLRGGVDDGAESAFVDGAARAEGVMDLFLPFPGFQESEVGAAVNQQLSYSRAVEIATRYQPAWSFLKAPAKKHAVAMVMKVLGVDLASPVRMIICWAPEPRWDRQGLLSDARGNVGVALRLASDMNIPAFHLDHSKHLQRINRLCGTQFELGASLARMTA